MGYRLRGIYYENLGKDYALSHRSVYLADRRDYENEQKVETRYGDDDGSGYALRHAACDSDSRYQ